MGCGCGSKGSCGKCSCAACGGRSSTVTLKTGAVVYSEWSERGGDYVRATADLVAKNFKNLTVRLFTKNLNDVGNGVEVDSSTTIALSAVGRQMKEWGSNTGTGLMQLVRYQYSITPTPQVNAAEFITFRMLQPCWFDAVLTVDPP